ncbi:hypothetical protein BN2537_7535 [Streptomyces venezuelae]|nr:hypothetical protein BN2537_7535 [Streptomyces venezuelae]
MPHTAAPGGTECPTPRARAKDPEDLEDPFFSFPRSSLLC